MTRRNRGWAPALVLVPGAAAAFAGLVGWAVHTEPQPVTVPVAAPRPATPPMSAQELALLRAQDRQDRELAVLQARLRTVSAQLDAMRRTGAPAASGVPGGAPGSVTPAPVTVQVGPMPSTGPVTGAAASPPPAAPSTAPVAVTPPSAAPPPPTQTTTGASGAKR
ncbi:MAG TPA: hypothetical protein VHO01_15265 [Jatrophihabitans sp.]|nr:hypothetical protein [Jatrophihabitans sp.]